MDIIKSWVDETEIRKYAEQLLQPASDSVSINEEEVCDFIIAPPEQVFVPQKFPEKKRRSEFSPKTQEEVDQMVEEITTTELHLGSDRAQNNAIKALQRAAKLTNAGHAVGHRFGSVKGLNEEAGWDGHQRVSAELKQHLGDSAGALLNRDAVTSSLDQLQQLLSSKWSCSEVCVSDRDGDVFVDSLTHPAWTRLTVSVTEPIRLLDIKQGAIGHGYMHLKMSATKYLQVVVCSTSHGLLILGMSRTQPIAPTLVKDLVADIRFLV